jgi:glutaredoxin-like protein NrdH
MAITIYTKPGCFGCRKTAEKFIEAHVAFTEVDLTKEPAALEYVTEELGCSQAPVVVVDGWCHWSGLDPTNIARAITLTQQEASG